MNWFVDLRLADMPVRIMKRLLTRVIVTITLVLFVSCNTGTYFGRWMTWRASDIRDYEKFPREDFQPSPYPFKFKGTASNSLDSLMVPVNKGKRERLRQVLENTGTTAFIVIRNDSLLYERYFNDYDRESINTSFSVGKSITSLIIGKAIDDGLLNSVDESVTSYFPELRTIDSRYDKVTIDHLLNMRSGIQFKDHDMPWGDKPKAYYHPELRTRIKELPITFEPGTRFQYNSYNPILAGMILEEASKQSPARYFEENIWNKLGMEHAGSWSLDSDKSGMTKMESGLNLTAIDFAKLGRLVLLNGEWNGEQIVSRQWMNKIREVTPQNKVPEFGNEVHYNRFWWLFSKDASSPYIVSGWGHLGQYLYVFPNEKVIVVRMGKELGKVASWKALFQAAVDNI
jgi:CubicO group peptidase (beta-lactamase class C family)